MTQQTDLHNWDIPVSYKISDEDTDQWGGEQGLTRFFNDQLDKAVILQGTLAKRPDGGTFPGLLYLQTDASPKELQWDNGASFDTIATLNADTIDGLDSTQLLRADQSDTIAGTLTATGIDSVEVNGVRVPDGTDSTAIQNAIDAVAPSNGTVHLDPSQTYTIASEITVAPHTTLHCNGATIEVTADVNGLFCNRGVVIHDLWIDVTATTYTSEVITVDTSRMSGTDHLEAFDSVHIDGEIRGPYPGGTGLALRASSTGGGISVGNTFYVTTQGLDVGVLIDPADSFINGPKFYTQIVHCVVGIDVLAEADLDFYGDIQPHGTDSDHAIRTALMGNRTIRLHGVIWDPTQFNLPALAGENIAIFSSKCRHIYNNNSSDGAHGQIGVEAWDGDFNLYDFSNNRKFQHTFFGSSVTIRVDDTARVAYYDDGELRFPTSSNLRLETRDVTTTPALNNGELTIVDSTVTASGNTELAVGQSDGSWVTMSGETFTPP